MMLRCCTSDDTEEKTKTQVDMTSNSTEAESEPVNVEIEMKNDGGLNLENNRFLNESIWRDIEEQMDRPQYESVLANMAEVIILHGYVILFVVALPIMPLLAYINSVVEIRVDIFNLFNARRPVPYLCLYFICKSVFIFVFVYD